MTPAVRLRKGFARPVFERASAGWVARLVPQGMLRGVGDTMESAAQALQRQVDALFADLARYEETTA